MNARCHPGRLLVVGDVMLDLDVRGHAERVSPEAPALVLKAESETPRLGGAGAVAALLAAFGARPVLAGVVGEDSEAQIVRRLVAQLPAPNSQLLTSSDRPTTVKQRLIGQTVGRGQQLLRVDRECCRALPEAVEDEMTAAALAALDDVQAVLISDYGKGVCTPKLLAAVLRVAGRKRLPVLVDPRRGGDYRIYRWATLVKPNRREAGEATGRDIRCPAQAFAAGKDLCARWGFGAAVITLDVDGLALITADGECEHFAARRREAADVTGAGDTALAALAVALAGGVGLQEACRLANAAAAGAALVLGLISPRISSSVQSVMSAPLRCVASVLVSLPPLKNLWVALHW